jgi:hypothetical protein
MSSSNESHAHLAGDNTQPESVTASYMRRHSRLVKMNLGSLAVLAGGAIAEVVGVHIDSVVLEGLGLVGIVGGFVGFAATAVDINANGSNMNQAIIEARNPLAQTE